MEWDIQSRATNINEDVSVSVPSTEGMPPLTDITKHKVTKRRTRTGSLNAHYCVPEPREAPHRDNSTAMMPPLTRIRKTPIAQGGSWDDNSVGHGSVAARMRRERNRAILRTQSSMTNPLCHSIDTHANVASTLNLINTTSLSPLPSERYHDNNEWIKYLWETPPTNYHSAATKSSAGSMCNITGYQSHALHQPWDTLSIPELHSSKSCDRTCHRTHHRHSYSSGYANNSYLHSSPTSGCASIASSDLDSADFMYFNINDDSSYFDGDSLFADSLGMIGDTNAAFSTNILSLLEEGSISCRTPFPASDWPDSISELDFDCSEGKSDDVANCDALSDIGPSCSSPPQRRRITKRQTMAQSKADEAETSEENAQPTVTDEQPCMSNADDNDPSLIKATAPSIVSSSETLPTNLNTTLNGYRLSETAWLSFTVEEKKDYIRKLTHTITQLLNFEEQMEIFKILVPVLGNGNLDDIQISVEEINFSKLTYVLKYLKDKKETTEKEWFVVKSPESQKNGIIKLKKQKKTSILISGCLDDDAPCCSRGKATNKMDMCESFGVNSSEVKVRPRSSAAYNFDEISMRSRVRPGSRQETCSNKSADPRHLDSCADSTCEGCSSNLRRSNSDGNIPKSIASETQREHRRQQRQARRWAKLLKTRQRKENRQLKKEHRSGLFVNEKKVKLKADYEEEIEVEIA